MTNIELIITDFIKQGEEFEIIRDNYNKEKPQMDYLEYVDFILDNYNFYRKQRNMPEFEAKFLSIYNSTVNALRSRK